jgi:predicted MFS family arabinose efflux permease
VHSTLLFLAAGVYRGEMTDPEARVGAGTSSLPPLSPPDESRVVLLVALVQLVNILDFMMVMPLGPYFADALHFPRSHVGYVGTAYTAAAGLSGVVGALFLDRFDRRRALLVAVLGLTVATALGGLAVDLPTLLAARVLAGLFGGPATSVALASVADVVPAERRGRALGIVMTAFSVASVLGVPFGLTLADLGGWRAPFFGVAALGAIVLAYTFVRLPSLRGHLRATTSSPVSSFGGLGAVLSDRLAWVALGTTSFVMVGSFALIPTIAPYLDANLDFPKPMLKLLYFAGGLVTIFTIRRAGRLVDRLGAFRVSAVGTLVLCVVIALGFVVYERQHTEALVRAAAGGLFDVTIRLGEAALPLAALAPMVLLFVGFMFSMSVRNVAQSATMTKVPRPELRAAFMSVQSAVQHFASATGALLSSVLLHDGPGGRLVGMPRVAGVSIFFAACVPWLLRHVERGVALRASPIGDKVIR